MKEATVETLYDRNGETPYQARVKCGDTGLRVHIFWRGDRDPDCHDHPADFWTFPLVSYVEEYHKPGYFLTYQRVVRAFRLHRRRAVFAHRIVGRWTGRDTDTDHGPIVTLAWWGKKRREWGFHTANGWKHWKKYVKQPGWKS